MSKKNIFISMGLLILSVASVIAGRLSMKFGSATSLYVTVAGGACFQITGTLVGSSYFTTVGTGFNQAIIVNSSGRIGKLWAAACTGIKAKKVYFHP